MHLLDELPEPKRYPIVISYRKNQDVALWVTELQYQMRVHDNKAFADILGINYATLMNYKKGIGRPSYLKTRDALEFWGDRFDMPPLPKRHGWIGIPPDNHHMTEFERIFRHKSALTLLD